MVKGETYDKQLFESEAFRHFINIFLNRQSGVTKGCELSRDLQNITVGQGYFCIQGGFLRGMTSTSNQIPSEAGYYKLVYEIDLSKINTEDEFNQGNYKFVKSLGEYPSLIQEDLDNGGTIYQFPFCQFRITEQGLQDFQDIRPIIDYGIYEQKIEFDSNSNGNYAKFKDGTLIQWGMYVGSNIEFNVKCGNFYRCTLKQFSDFPISFYGNKNNVNVFMEIQNISTPEIVFLSKYGGTDFFNAPSIKNPGSFTLIKEFNSNADIRVSYFAIGRWK